MKRANDSRFKNAMLSFTGYRKIQKTLDIEVKRIVVVRCFARQTTTEAWVNIQENYEYI